LRRRGEASLPHPNLR